MRTALTAAFAAKARAEPTAERSIYWDARVPNFGLMVTTSGARSFVVQYRVRGRSRRLTLKHGLTLDEARKEARKILGDVAKGADPLEDRRKIEAAATNTLEFIACDYFRRERKKVRTMATRQATLERLVFPKLGRRQIGDISRTDITRILDRIEDQCGPVMADQTLAYLRRIFSWHAIRVDGFNPPIVRGMGRSEPQERARARVLSDDEVRSVWRTAENHPGPFSSLIKYILLTGARRSEAAGMRRPELGESIWTIPAERHKTKKEFLLPLSSDALAVLAAIPQIGTKKDGYYFTATGRGPLRGFACLKAKFDRDSGAKNYGLHDLRRTARTLMSRAGVPSDYAERALGHTLGRIRGIYDRHAYLAEKRAALEALATELRRIIPNFMGPD
jgi:integrase